jgi:hypothetical protein
MEIRSKVVYTQRLSESLPRVWARPWCWKRKSATMGQSQRQFWDLRGCFRDASSMQGVAIRLLSLNLKRFEDSALGFLRYRLKKWKSSFATQRYERPFRDAHDLHVTKQRTPDVGLSGTRFQLLQSDSTSLGAERNLVKFVLDDGGAEGLKIWSGCEAGLVPSQTKYVTIYQ